MHSGQRHPIPVNFCCGGCRRGGLFYPVLGGTISVGQGVCSQRQRNKLPEKLVVAGKQS